MDTATKKALRQATTAEERRTILDAYLESREQAKPPTWEIVVGDSVEVLATLAENSVDAIVTDPPYGLEFMGKEWDKLGGNRTSKPGIGDRETPWVNSQGWNTHRCRNCGHLSHGGSPCSCDSPDFAAVGGRGEGMEAWHYRWAVQAYRVLKPGGHLLAFGGTRTYHRLASAVEDAGFEIRDQMQWLYGTGFPKSHNISKAIDRAAGAEREYIGEGKYAARKPRPYEGGIALEISKHDPRQGHPITAPATPAAAQWEGWGTALKPAHEPIVVARKPLIGTVAKNVLEWGAGGLNIDATRVEYVDESDKSSATPQGKVTSKEIASIGAEPDAGRDQKRIEFDRPEQKGRWPANVILDDEAGAMLDAQTGETGNKWKKNYGDQYADESRQYEGGSFGGGGYKGGTTYADRGGASRFFYSPKASKSEREAGLTPPEDKKRANDHPTVKPVALMRYLIRLVTPPGGVILDPFVGSGSTGIAAVQEGFWFVGVDVDADYCELARTRIAHAEEGEGDE